MATVIESFVGDYLLNKLVTFAEDKVVMIIGAKDELKRLEKRLKRVGAYLKDAEKRRINEDSIKNWLNELRDLVYEADDMIDLWRYKSQQLPTKEPPTSSSSPTCCSLSLFSCFRTITVRHELAEQVQSLNLRLDEIMKDMSSLSLQHIKSNNVHEVRTMYAPISSPIIGVDVVGKEIEEGAKKLVKFATLDNNKIFNIVAITGMGGIGKTTLAKKIYNNQTIAKRYETKMWLSITQSYSSVQLVKEAIRNARGNPGQAERESELLPILAGAISGKSLFLVLDDVWYPDVWVDLLEDTIRTNVTQGFILITTRDETIAKQMGAQHIHQATILSAKSGWELLCRKAYLSDIQDIKNLEEIGTKIVEKCGGLPIAIKAIGGMLAKKDKNKYEWQNVLTSSVWSINGLPKDIDQALYVSYEDLPPQLRQCFLYCSLYTPNDNMFRSDLIRDWIAEGFIEQRSDQIMEITAEGYYQELIARHLLELDLYEAVDNTQCRMHDLLRSLAQYLSREESFAGDQVLPHVVDLSRLRRLSISETNERVSIPGPATEQLKLRTLLIYNCQYQIENDIVLRFKHLRHLLINEKGLRSIPESIGDLIHLRKLDLDRTSISTLPESVGSLTNLLVLNLQGCELLSTLPRGILQLCNLRHLDLQDTPLAFVPKGLERLEKLTEIMGFLVSHDEGQNGWDLQELEKLSQLRRMSISKLERARNVPVVLANKTHLKELHLMFSEEFESSGHMEQVENQYSTDILDKLYPPPSIEDVTITNYRGQMLPTWMSASLGDRLPNLQYLELIGWSCCTNLPPLGSLPNLKFLKLEGASAIVRISSEFLGIKGCEGANFPSAFPKLEYLIFNDMPKWEEWVLSDFEGEKSQFWKLMPRIKGLRFNNCPKLRALPKGLQQLIAIEELTVYESHSIRCIQDFPFECEQFDVKDNKGLESLSNLPGVKGINIYSNPKLRHVSKLDSLEQIYLEDFEMQHLPEWLMKLIEEREGMKEAELHLNLFCSRTLLERCLKDGPDWPIIKCFSSVTVYDKEITAYLEYTREPELYFARL